ncbi:MAG: hypothetical protein NTW76_06425 [Corynebacteriales bacterium]|nr:hypothetical protein [Mycobacteriales bacterium]
MASRTIRYPRADVDSQKIAVELIGGEPIYAQAEVIAEREM